MLTLKYIKHCAVSIWSLRGIFLAPRLAKAGDQAKLVIFSA